MAGPPAHRLGDLCRGHCFNVRPNNEASPNVFINRIPAHRRGDGWPIHCCGDSCHDSVTVGGSSSVFINRRCATRIGDALSCGDACNTGSPNVFIGG